MRRLILENHAGLAVARAALLAWAALSSCGTPLRDFAAAAEGSTGGGGSGGVTGKGGASAAGGQSPGAGGETSKGGSPGNGGSTANAGSGADAAGGDGGSGSEPACGAPETPCCEADVCVSGASCNDSVCACDDGLSACDGACVDLDADAKNCGRCAHDCLGGACDLGTCQAVTIAQNQDRPLDVASDGTYVYWSADVVGEPNYVARRRADVSDGVKVLAPEEDGASSITVAGDKLYWISNGHVRVCDAPDCSSGPADLIQTLTSTSCGAVLFDQEKLFWSCGSTYNAKDGALWSLALPQTTPAVLGPNPSNPGAMASDGTNLYWINSSTYTNDLQNTDGGVYKARLSDGVTTPLYTGLRGDIGPIAVGGGALYLAGAIDKNDGTGQTLGILRLPLPNGLATTYPLPIFVDTALVTSIVADDDFIYFTQPNADLIARCPESGCTTPEVIAPGEDSPRALAQDDVSIYWTDFDSGLVRRLAK